MRFAGVIALWCLAQYSEITFSSICPAKVAFRRAQFRICKNYSQESTKPSGMPTRKWMFNRVLAVVTLAR
jgi:hypothetical protein